MRLFRRRKTEAQKSDSQKTEALKCNRGVAFKKEVDIKEFESVPPEMKYDVWYTRPDMEEMHEHNILVLEMLKKGLILPEDTTRGLLEDQALMQKKATVDRAVQVVLKEQQQNSKASKDPQNLANLYRSVTKDCVLKSIELAEWDARAASRYVMDVRKKLCKNERQECKPRNVFSFFTKTKM